MKATQVLLRVVAGDTWWPSLANSAAMTSSPHSGSSVHIRRMSARVSASMGGRPTGRRDRRRQIKFHRERCQRITVSGRTMGTAATSDGNSLVMAPMVKRSRALRRGWGVARLSRITCWRRRVFSAKRTLPGRNKSQSAARRAFTASRSIAREYQRMTSTGICTRTLCADIPACGRRLRKSRFPCCLPPS